MKNLHKIDAYKLITDYILKTFSDYKENIGIYLDKDFIEDIAKFNYILGRMENYFADKEDLENYELTCLWFEKEMDDRNYSWTDFLLFVENNLNTEDNDVDNDVNIIQDGQ